MRKSSETDAFKILTWVASDLAYLFDLFVTVYVPVVVALDERPEHGPPIGQHILRVLLPAAIGLVMSNSPHPNIANPSEHLAFPLGLLLFDVFYHIRILEVSP